MLCDSIIGLCYIVFQDFINWIFYSFQNFICYIVFQEEEVFTLHQLTFRPVFLNLFAYVAHTTFGKNCVTHYLVSIGYAFIRVKKYTHGCQKDIFQGEQ